MNAKKPFLAMKTKKCKIPYLLDGEEAVLQKEFFDYLMNLVSGGKYHVYVDTEKKEIYGCANGEAPEKIETGYYFRMKKRKIRSGNLWCG